ncbi:RNA polymerase sigma factor, partial [bacterium]|nr:RNA polymerase sigma factor [bacterium]
MKDPFHESDKELILQVRKGRKESFRFIVDRYWSRLRSVIRRAVKSPELNEDLCQETFLKAFHKIDQFDTSRELCPWLMKIAFNLIAEHFRKSHQRFQFVPLNETDFPASSQSEPHEMLSRRMVFEECLDLLPEIYRVVFALRHGMMFTLEEISFVLDEPLGTVKV